MAAILFPVFGRARENARRSACQSNLKQLSLGILQYIQDYDEIYPLAWHNIDNSSGNSQNQQNERGWSYNIQPYIKSVQVYQCPSEDNPPPNYNFITNTNGHMNQNYVDYVYNRNLSDPAITATKPTVTTVNSAQLSFASNTVLLCENAGVESGRAIFGGTTGGTRGSAPDLAVLCNVPEGGSARRHLEGSNFAFADGHVKWFKSRGADRPWGVYNDQTPPTGSNATFAIN